MPAVVFATKRGRELGCRVPRGVVEVDGTSTLLAALDLHQLVNRSQQRKLTFLGCLRCCSSPRGLGNRELGKRHRFECCGLLDRAGPVMMSAICTTGI